MRPLISLIFVCSSLLMSINTAVATENNTDINNADINQVTLSYTNLSAIIPAYKATYTLLHKSDTVGSAIRQLSYLDNNQVRYHYETDVSWLFLSDERQETAIVTVQNNQVIPQHYNYQREGTGRDKYYQWQYNLADKTATDLINKKSIILEVTDGLLDRLSYHLQNRLDLITNPEKKSFIYPVISYKGSVKNYEYQWDGEETLKLPYGSVKTIRLKREITEKKRITYAWFAPELNYLLVKLYQVKDGEEQFEAQLSTVD